MNASTINRNTGNTLQPATVAGPSNAANVQQRSEQPTQRASHSLASVGKRMLKNVGKLFQKSQTPQQTSAKTPTVKPAPALSDAQAAQRAAREIRQPGSRLQGSDGTRQSMLRPNSDQASSSGAQVTEPDAPAPIAGATPSLLRSHAGRFDLQEDLLVRGAQPQNTIKLSAEGKADFANFNPPGLPKLLNDILAKPQQTYLAHLSQPGAQEHLLLESSGHLLHLTQTASSLSLIRNSEKNSSLNGSAPMTVSLQREADRVHIERTGKRDTVELPGKAHIAHITGVHEAPDGERFRVHEDRLYQFNQTTGRWKAPDNTQDIAFNGLTTGGNGAIYAKSDNALVDISSPLKPHLEAQDLQSFSVARDNMAALLIEGNQTVLLADMSPGLSGAHRAKILDLEGGQAQAVAIGLSADRLFIADNQGKLYSADRVAFDNDDVLLRLNPEQDNYTLQDNDSRENNSQPKEIPLGGHNSVIGFISGGDGRVHALVQNRVGEVHSHALDEEHSQLESGWNLSQVLVLDNLRGLPEAPAPSPADRLNLDRAGLVGLSEGRIQRWDATPQCWKDTSVKDIDRLQRGADSNAYVLKGGKLLKLDVSPEHQKIAFSPTSALTQTRRSTKVAMGTEIKGLDDRVITAFAMVNDKQFSALDDQKRLTVHHQDREPIDLDLPGLEGDIKVLALDEKHDLHAVTSTGALYRLPKEAWQAQKPADHPQAKWTQIPTPDGQSLSNIHSNDDNALSAQAEDAPGQGLMKLKGNEWQPFEPRPAEQNGLNELFSKIFQSHKTTRIPGTGGTARLEVNVLGRGGMEKANRASTSEFVRANIYKNTLETPRVIKNIGNHIQHRYHGREGLKPLYESQSILFKRLELIHETATQPPAPGKDLKARIEGLNLGPSGATLVKELEAFRDELEKHTYTALTDIGQGYGKVMSLRQRDGQLNLHGELSKPSQRAELGKTLAELTTKLNFKSSGHDLVNELQNALAQVAPSAENRTAELLNRLKDNGLKLSHQKADIPLGQRRDSSDELGLSKARLALDMVTLHSIGGLLDKLELLTPAADVSTLHEELKMLRDTTYGEHPVKQVTDMGFTGHDTLESAYDAIKTFLKVFKKADHAVSVNMRAATGSKDQAELTDKLKSILKQLEHADDEISLQRSYGLNLSSPLTMLANKGLGPWPSAAATGNRNYVLNAERGEAGITLYLLRDAVGSLSAGLGGGKDFWPDLFDENNPARSVDIGNNRRLTPNLRLGADLTGTATGTQRAGVVFRVADEDIDHFVDSLFKGKLNPLEVLNKAFDHETHQARRFNFDITGSASAEMRIGFNLSETGSNPLSAVARLGGAATVNVNLLTYTDYSLTQNNDKVHLREGGENRVQLANSAAIGLQARAQLSGTHTNATPPTNPGLQSAANNLGIAATVTADSRTTKRVKFRYQVAEPMTTASLAKVATSLGDAFKDSASKAELAALKNPLDPRYNGKSPEAAIQTQLDGLNAFFAAKPWQNDGQYKALRDLKRATIQQVASANNHSVLENARFESNSTNLSRLDEQSMITSIISLVKKLSNPSNASRVAAFINEDPKLKAMLKEMQASSGNLARVRLEPKDSLIDEIDEGSRAGTMTQGDLAGLLENRNNMRIRALTVFHTATQSESFTSPSPLVSYNSTASLGVTKAVGRIVFTYGADQDKPIGYTFDGELSRPSEALKSATSTLKEAGFELKS